MAITGVAITSNAEPFRTALVGKMLESLRVNGDDFVAAAAGLWAHIGATSTTNSASVWSSEELLVACDGNLPRLRNQLGDEPISEANDAQLIGILYRKFGESFLGYLRGSFSVAIWDNSSQTMLIAVDRFAVKPLYYFADERQIVFSSQPRGIFAACRLPRKANPEAIAAFLNFSMVPAPISAFSDLEKLSGGCYLTWTGGKSCLKRYWDLQYSECDRSSTHTLAEELRSRMQEAVEVYSENIAVRELGCFLSGGTDSSSILGLLSRHRHTGIKAFSIGFAEQAFNELEYARIAAREYKARHEISVLTAEGTFPDIHKIAAAYDEPFGNASVLPTYACLKLAREHGVEVMLAGDGGDELFGGNERYQTERKYGLYDALPSYVRRGLIEPLAVSLPSFGLAGKARRYIGRLAKGNPERYFQWLLLQAFAPEAVLDRTVRNGRSSADLLAIPRAHYKNAPAHSELNRLLYIDIKMTLGDNDLPKVVRAAELAGVNVRFPYLDHPLADFSGRLPVQLKVRGFEKRYLFKKAMAGLLPEAILRKKKHGFGLPIGMWLKQHPLWRGFAQDILLEPRTYQRGYFQRSFVEDLFRKMDGDNSTYYGDLLWLFMMLELWHRYHIESAAERAAA
jgi:asparagine synthase (glutamine-hydrolysing)